MRQFTSKTMEFYLACIITWTGEGDNIRLNEEEQSSWITIRFTYDSIPLDYYILDI